MFDWLFEGRTSVYVVLAALAVFLLLIWWQTRMRWLLVGIAVVAASIGLYALLDKSVETDREQIVRIVQEMAAAVDARDLDGLFEHISDSFRSPLGKDKKQFREEIANYLKGGMVQNVRVWDIVCVEAPSREHAPVRVYFSAKGESVRELLADCEATFDYDAQHGWRLRGLRLLKPQSNEELQIQL